MDLKEGSETLANHNRTPGKYPKEHIQCSKHGESLKSRNIFPLLGIKYQEHVDDMFWL
jgi:hypothetical protein